MRLIYNTTTQQLIERIAAQLPHALLIEGIDGVGLYTIAEQLAGNTLTGVIRPTDIDGTVDVTAKGLIRVTQIRELTEHANGKSHTTRTYVIDDADTMNQTAQNAFLKLLEEPIDSIRFILTSHHTQTLLPTILSRVQRLKVNPIDESQSSALLDDLRIMDTQKRSQLLFLAAGRPAALMRLASDDKLFTQQAELTTDARQFIQGSVTERLIIAHRYHGDRAKALALLTQAQAILTRSIHDNPSKSLILLADRLTSVYERIRANGNIRLHLVSFVV